MSTVRIFKKNSPIRDPEIASGGSQLPQYHDHHHGQHEPEGAPVLPVLPVGALLHAAGELLLSFQLLGFFVIVFRKLRTGRGLEGICKFYKFVGQILYSNVKCWMLCHMRTDRKIEHKNKS